MARREQLLKIIHEAAEDHESEFDEYHNDIADRIEALPIAPYVGVRKQLLELVYEATGFTHNEFDRDLTGWHNDIADSIEALYGEAKTRQSRSAQ